MVYFLEILVVGEFIYMEIIGVLVEILFCDDLKDGWVGSWNFIIFNGIIINFLLIKFVNIVFLSILRVYILDNGVIWFNFIVLIVNNSISG